MVASDADAVDRQVEQHLAYQVGSNEVLEGKAGPRGRPSGGDRLLAITFRLRVSHSISSSATSKGGLYLQPIVDALASTTIFTHSDYPWLNTPVHVVIVGKATADIRSILGEDNRRLRRRAIAREHRRQGERVEEESKVS
ncbi:hypothetical protein, partial [Xanthobacter aminoxidans]